MPAGHPMLSGCSASPERESTGLCPVSASRSRSHSIIAQRAPFSFICGKGNGSGARGTFGQEPPLVCSSGISEKREECIRRMAAQVRVGRAVAWPWQ